MAGCGVCCDKKPFARPVLGMVMTMFPEQKELAKVIGVYAFMTSAGGAVAC